MHLGQVYYTSCQVGLRGGKGFQVNAASGQIGTVVLQQIERLGLYVPPASAPTRPSPEEIELFPLSLFYNCLQDGTIAMGQAKYVGTDYSGRYGNYFTHCLVSDRGDPLIDRLPIELWRSPVWHTEESVSTEIPPLESVESGTIITSAAVEGFVAAHLDRLPAMITAVEGALMTGRRLVIVDTDEATAFWIAALCSALPRRLALQLTFNTYVKSVYSSTGLVVGTTPDSDFRFSPLDVEHNYYVFDFVGDRFTPIEPSGFATKVVASSAARGGSAMREFASFATRVVPLFPSSELEDVFDVFALATRLDIAGIGRAEAIAWCATHMEEIDPTALEGLMKAATMAALDSSSAPDAIVVLTDLFRSAIRAGRHDLDSIVTPLYIEWLVRNLPVAGSVVIASVARKLEPLLRTPPECSESVQQQWLQHLQEAGDAQSICALVQLGDRLGIIGAGRISSELVAACLLPLRCAAGARRQNRPVRRSPTLGQIQIRSVRRSPTFRRHRSRSRNRVAASRIGRSSSRRCRTDATGWRSTSSWSTSTGSRAATAACAASCASCVTTVWRRRSR